MKKRILSLLLTLAMVLTLAPVAFAAGDDAAQDANSVEAADTAQVEPQEAAGEAEDTTVAKIGEVGYATLEAAISAATEGATITLQADVTGQTVIPAGKKLTLDLNGHKMTHTNDVLCNLGTLTVTDSKKTGEIISTGNGGIYTAANANTTVEYAKVSGQEGALCFGGDVTGATLIVKDGVFTGVDNAVVADNGKKRDGTANTITIKGGTFNGNIESSGYVACGIYAPWNDNITVTGGTFNITKGAGIVARAGTVTVTGGTFKTTGNVTGKVGDSRVVVPCSAIVFDVDADYPAKTPDSKITVTGGTFTSEVAAIATVGDAKRVSVAGGVFSSNVTDYCADGVKTVRNSDGTYTVKSKYVAQVGGETKYETLQAAITAAGDGATVTLLDDATEDVTIAAGKNITLDLGGKTLTNTNAGKATISVTSGTVTVKNGTVLGGTNYYNIEVKAGAALTLDEVTATAGNNGSSMIDNFGTLKVNSGTYTGGLDTLKNEPVGTVIINGGKFELLQGTSKGYTGTVFNYGNLTINDGEFLQSDTQTKYGYPQVVYTDKDPNTDSMPSTKIVGGTFKNSHSSTTAWTIRSTNAATANTTVTGGKFNKKVSSSYLQDGYASTTTKVNGYYGLATAITAVTLNATEVNLKGGESFKVQVTDMAPNNAEIQTYSMRSSGSNSVASFTSSTGLVKAKKAGEYKVIVTPAGAGATAAECVFHITDGDAAIGTTQYPTLAEAIAAAKDNQTVKLLNDVDLGKTIAVSGKTITLDMNGHKIYNTEDLWKGNDWSLISVQDGGNLTITGNGTLKSKADDCYAADVQDENATLTIENGTLVGNIHAVYVQKGTAYIKGGTYSIQQTYPSADKAYEFVLNLYDANRENGTAKMVVTGGTFVKFNPANCQAEGANTNFCAPGYKTELTNGVYVVKSGTNDAMELIDKALETGATDKTIKEAVDAVASTPNETLANSSTTMDKLAQLEEKVEEKNNNITVTISSAVAEVSEPTATNAKLSANPNAEGDQTITIDVTANTTASTKEAMDLVGGTTATAMEITMKLNNEPIQPKAPVVLTFDLPANWANAQIVYMNGDKAEKIPTTVSNGEISGVFNHFSTYVLVQTAAAENPNKYEIVLTPDKTDVSAGDTLTYTISLKHTAAGNNNELKGQFEFTPAVTAGLLELDPTSTELEEGVVFGLNSDKNYQFNVTDLQLAVNNTKAIGKLVYKVGAYGTNNANVEVLETSTANVTNDGRQVEATVSLTNEKDVTYHITKATFKQGVGTKLEHDIIGYVRYGTNEVYSSLEEQAKGSTAGERLAIPELKLDTTGGTTYRVKDIKWHLNDAEGKTYELEGGIKTDVTFVENLVKLAKVDIPKEDNKALVEITDKVTRTDNGDSYVDQGEDLKFKLTDDAAPDPGMENVVKVKVDGAEVTVTGPADGSYTVDGSKITGEVTFEITQKLALTADDIKIFTKKDDATGLNSYREYSTYSDHRTLVLFKGDKNATYVLKAEGDQPAIYRTDAYEGGYTYAVLVDPATTEATQEDMLTYLVNTLKLNTSKDTSVTNTVINYDWNTNGRDGAKLADAQATRDFMKHKSDEMYWTPSDELLLKADVITLTGDDKHAQASYEGKPDGYVSTDDVNTFLYLYAGLAYSK